MGIENNIGTHLIENHVAGCDCDLCKLVEYANTAMNVTSELNRLMNIDPPLFIVEMPNRLRSLLLDIRSDLANYHQSDDDRISVAMGKLDSCLG